MDYLIEIGALTAPANAQVRPVREGLIDHYRDYLTVERAGELFYRNAFGVWNADGGTT